uniref:Uncharacterized protein n=1 Tax=viral metagenome TaxID=1070528 RepID=A0A6C0EW04_9ZZZZ
MYGKANVSTMAMRAVSDDGSNWHVDTDVNGIKNHENLTNSDIMKIMSHRAHKVDLRTRLLQSLRGVGVDRHEMQQMPEIRSNNMFGEIDYPRVHIYRKKCPRMPILRSSRPVLMGSLSPLHEATIVPRNEFMHLVPLDSLHSMKPKKPSKKRHIKGKKSRKNRK